MSTCGAVTSTSAAEKFRSRVLASDFSQLDRIMNLDGGFTTLDLPDLMLADTECR
jgi:hypothetical protein